MSGSNYESCPGCDRKALYVGDQDVPEGVEVWHAACRTASPAPLLADPAVTCQATADALPSRPHGAGGCTLCVGGLCTEVCTDHPCTAMSRFVVERSDGDQSFGWDGKHESCAGHLADVVTGMVSGDDVRAVVAIRWDRPDCKPEGA
jgi:hypothetical protein